jgi:predicted 3-demethylubiquinone-9 3-methyltransferase (glyoxalase superfamily)
LAAALPHEVLNFLNKIPSIQMIIQRINDKQKIAPFLTFNDQAEEAMNLYVSVFKNSKILNIWRQANDKLMSATFQIEGQTFMVLNGGPDITFSPGFSLFVNCETQAEVDELWDKLSEGGEQQPCGWLKDKFGVCWQIIPTALSRLLGDPDPVKSKQVMEAMLKMKKIEIDKLVAASELKDSPLPLLAAPAMRALEDNGITTLQQLAEYREAEILYFHGMGPSSVPKLRQALKEEGLSFKN